MRCSTGNVLEEVAGICDSINFQPTQIPSEYSGLPPVEAIRRRLIENVQRTGGYAVLAQNLPAHRANIWQKKIESGEITTKEFLGLSAHFRDAVLVGLICADVGAAYYDLSEIPPSEYSLQDLVWALRRRQAQLMTLQCDMRESQLNGESVVALQGEAASVAKEMLVLVHQIDMATKESVGVVTGQDVNVNKLKQKLLLFLAQAE